MLNCRLPIRYPALILVLLASSVACTKSSRPAIEASKELPGEVELVPEQDLPETIRQFKVNINVAFPEGASVGKHEQVLALKCQPAASIAAQSSRSDQANLRVNFELLVQTFAESTVCEQIIIGDSLDLYFEAEIDQEFTAAEDVSEAQISMNDLILAPNDKIAADKALNDERQQQQRARMEEEEAYAMEIAADIASRQEEIAQLQDDLRLEQEKALKAQKEANDKLLERIRDIERKNAIIAEKDREIAELKKQLEEENRNNSAGQRNSKSQLTIDRDNASALVELIDERITQIYFESCKESEIFDVNVGECRNL